MHGVDLPIAETTPWVVRVARAASSAARCPTQVTVSAVTKLAGHKCPTSVELRTELGRTATGELHKYKLREPFWIGMTTEVN